MRFTKLVGWVTLGMRFMFFASPVFWQLGENPHGLRKLLFDWNPLTYLINFSRSVLQGQWPSTLDMLFSFSLCSFVLLVGLILYLLVGKQVKNVS